MHLSALVMGWLIHVLAAALLGVCPMYLSRMNKLCNMVNVDRIIAYEIPEETTHVDEMRNRTLTIKRSLKELSELMRVPELRIIGQDIEDVTHKAIAEEKLIKKLFDLLPYYNEIKIKFEHLIPYLYVVIGLCVVELVAAFAFLIGANKNRSVLMYPWFSVNAGAFLISLILMALCFKNNYTVLGCIIFVAILPFRLFASVCMVILYKMMEYEEDYNDGDISLAASGSITN